MEDTQILAFIADVLVPGVAFIVMMIVGLDLTLDDFRRAAKSPRTVALTTIGQVILLPLLAVGLARGLAPDPVICYAMLFLALSPGGAISNYYTHLTGHNAALSVTLTAVSTIFCLLSIPLTANLFLQLTGLEGAALQLPGHKIVMQLILFVLIPVIAGMALGRNFERQLAPLTGKLRIFSLLLIAFLLVSTLSTVGGEFISNLPQIIAVGIIFTLGAMSVGFLISRFVDEGDRHVVIIESTIRNIPVTALISAGLAVDPVFAGFLTGYFLVEVLIMVPFAFWVRKRLAMSATSTS